MTSNVTVDDCFEYSEETGRFLDLGSFWLDGIIKSVLAIFGIVGNVVASIILLRPSMRNSFNLLLVSLAIVDSSYLLGSMLESIRSYFGVTRLHLILFPYFLYPMNKFFMTASIFLTVAIAIERYVAVHYPIDYNIAMNDPSSLRYRLMRYLLPVLVLSLLFNVTKFLEVKLIHEPGSSDPHLTVTELREDQTYSAFLNWSRLIGLGIVPFFLLVFFNYQIYQEVEARRRRNVRLANNRHHLSPVVAQPQMSLAIEAEAAVDPVETTEMRTLVVVSEQPGQTSRSSFVLSKSENDAPGGNDGTRAQSWREKRRRIEDSLAVVFMGFIAMFLFCHSLRIMLDIHELVTLEQANLCNEAGFRDIPAWSLAAVHLSHFLLVINSSTTILIYCGLSSKFREEFIKALK